MGFWRHYYHLVWATKKREAFIRPELEKEIYPYIVSKAAELGCYVHAINGMPDHTHLVISIPPKHAVAWMVKTLKGASSHFINFTLRPPEFHFGWQRGYGSMTLGESKLEWAKAYVLNQKQHHQAQTTNDWFERFDDFDDEETDIAQPGAAPRILREDKVTYVVDIPEDELPF